MAVFVDNARLKFRGMQMCHMIADSTRELTQIGKRLGLKQRWIQHLGEKREHYDICLSKRRRAVEELGAIEVTQVQLAAMIKYRWIDGSLPDPIIAECRLKREAKIRGSKNRKGAA